MEDVRSPTSAVASIVPMVPVHVPKGTRAAIPNWCVRRSEACGFDIGRTTSELFGIELKWGADGKMPEYLTLVCGFFHDGDGVVW